MEIPVLIEPIRGNGYVARAGSPFDWSAEGHTAEEALQRLREEVAARMAAGTRVASITVPEAMLLSVPLTPIPAVTIPRATPD